MKKSSELEKKDEVLAQQQSSMHTQANNIQNLSKIVASNAEKEKKFKRGKQKDTELQHHQVEEVNFLENEGANE